MPDLPTIAGGPSETASTPASSTGIAITANASANTKATTWTELIASTAYETSWLLVSLGISSDDVGYLVDIGVGASTAEVALIDNLYFHTSQVNEGHRHFLFPLRIPRGTRISARCQCAVGSQTIVVSVITIAAPISAPPSLGRVETMGANTSDSNGVSVDSGAVANTDAVGELIASTGFAYRWMCLSVANPTDVVWGGTRSFLVDVLVGGAGSEVVVVSDLHFSGSSFIDRPQPGTTCFPVAIPAGSRVAVRQRMDGTGAGDRVLDYVGYGVG